MSSMEVKNGRDHPSSHSIAPVELNVPCRIPADPCPPPFPFVAGDSVATHIFVPSLTIERTFPLTNAGNSNAVYKPDVPSLSTLE